MRFTTPLIAASLPFLVLSSPTRIHSNEKGRSIPISKRGSTFVDHGVVNITALRAHLAYVGAKYHIGLKNYERNTSPVHPLAWDRATHATKRDITTSALTDVRDSIWWGNISVGNPPVTFAIYFDTGSSDFFIPDVSCMNCGALRSARYSPSLSSTSSAVGKSFSLVYGDGSSVSGYQYIDAVTVAGLTAKRQTLGSATALSQNFQTGAMDGLMGLAWPASSEFGATPFFNTLMQQGTVSQGVFAFYLSESGSELRLGGTDESLYSTPLQWIPVTQRFYWRVGLDKVNVRGTEVVSGLSAIIDSGTTLIVGDPPTVREFYRHIPDSAIIKGDVNNEFFTYPCHYDPRISVTFNGASYPIGFNFGPVSNGSSQCLGGIVGLAGTPFWILGDIFMRSVYTAFNFDNASIGFARLKSEWDPKFS
ncbi:acid protease [Cantharellus anzutake]|uniref:acid protease n=1 Tax=Cantharellus anzutake TaxID=1750568 RepID=UPI0019080C9B|nr:acid protease [Cantharellus anzutake]KAF8339055.1 acid protease [Cantharellus anzutake]